MKFNLLASNLSLVIILASSSVEAKRECFEQHPVFSVDGVEVWEEGLPAREVFEEASKREIPNAKRINKEGILLADLVSDHAKKGTLYIQSCGKNSFTVEVKNLLSKDRAVSGYYLALTKKGTFKIIYSDGVAKAKSEMKRVSSLKLVTK